MNTKHRALVRFKVTRDMRILYVFEYGDAKTIQFLDQLRATKREFEVVSAPNHYVLSGRGSSPPIILTSKDGEILEGSNAIGSRCFSWRSKLRDYRVVGRRADWRICNFHAFHVHSEGRRIAYWDQPKRYGDIRGVYWDDYPAIEIATIVFGLMYDWDAGGHWSQ